MTIGVVEWIQGWQNGFFDFFFQFMSFLGEDYVYIVLLSTLYFAINKKHGEFTGLVLFFAGMFNSVIKAIVASPRPFQEYPNRVENLRPETSSGYSFPSGHTQMFSSVLFAQTTKYKHPVLLYIAIVFSVLMGISRMYLGVHYLEDVVVSMVLGILTAYGLYQLFKRYQDNDTHLIRLYLVILVLFLPFTIILNYGDLWVPYGLMIGFTAGMVIEKKYINFTLDVVWWKKALRVVGSLVIMVTIMIGLDIVFEAIAEEGTTLLNIFDMIRYGLMAFIGLGLYPFLFQKWNF